MTAVIALANLKGGVGKTTSALYLGAALADSGRRVLLVDMDPQASATLATGCEPDTQLGRALLGGGVASPHWMDAWGFAVIPSAPELARADVEMRTQMDGDRSLTRLLRLLENTCSFDAILIDCPASLGPLTVNALAAATHLVVPLETSSFAVHAMSIFLSGTVAQVRERLNPTLDMAGVLITMHDQRSALSREVLASVRERMGTAVFSTVIPLRVALREAVAAGRRLGGVRDATVLAAYAAAADELVDRCGIGVGQHASRERVG